RRTALISAAAVVACGLVILAGSELLDAVGEGRERARDTAASVSKSAAAPESASGTPRPAAEGSAAGGEAGSGPEAGDESSAGRPGAGADGSAAGTTPRAHAYGALLVNSDNSLSLTDGTMREDRKGDIRFDCANASCALESDTSVFTILLGDPGADYEECRRMTADQDAHRLPLAAASAGTEICVRRDNGDIVLFVVQVKSTALPEAAFVTMDTTVWPGVKN
ncbi:serine-threonine protein kinase, partial [Streptomyces coelicoflavus ZG0656]